MRRFIAVVTNLTPEDEKEFVAYIRKNRCGWWHKAGDLWLIIDRNDKLTHLDIRTFLKDLNSSRVGLVMPAPRETDNWAGFAPTEQVDDTFAWLKRNWVMADESE